MDKELMRREIKGRLKSPISRRIALRELETGQATEIYRLDDDGSGKPMFFDITGMREWCLSNAKRVVVPPDFERCMQLVKSGAVEAEHIRNFTIHRAPEPIIICRYLAGSDQIVDGAHRYVALCAAMHATQIFVPVPAYLLPKSKWQKFVMPEELTKFNNFESS